MFKFNIVLQTFDMVLQTLDVLRQGYKERLSCQEVALTEEIYFIGDSTPQVKEFSERTVWLIRCWSKSTTEESSGLSSTRDPYGDLPKELRAKELAVQYNICAELSVWLWSVLLWLNITRIFIIMNLNLCIQNENQNIYSFFFFNINVEKNTTGIWNRMF